MITKVRTKIRSLIQDLSSTDYEVFTYTISPIFTLSEQNIITTTKVLKNGAELGTAEFSYDSTTGKIEITASLVQNDKIEVDYSFNKYSDTELDGYITSALVWISIFAYEKTDYELENNDFYPTPDNKTLDLISLISSILIKPNYSRYSLPNTTVVYPRNMSKEEKIEKLITRFNRGLGVYGILEII